MFEALKVVGYRVKQKIEELVNKATVLYEEKKRDEAIKAEVREFYDMSPLGTLVEPVFEEGAISTYECKLEITDGVSEPIEDYLVTTVQRTDAHFNHNVYEKNILMSHLTSGTYLSKIHELVKGCIRHRGFQNSRRIVVAVGTISMAEKVQQYLSLRFPKEGVQFVGRSRAADSTVFPDTTIVVVICRGNFAGLNLGVVSAVIQTVPSGNEQLNREGFRLLLSNQRGEESVFISIYNPLSYRQEELMERRALVFIDMVAEGWF